MIWDLKFSHQNSVVNRTSTVNAIFSNASLTVARKYIQYIRIHIQYPHLMRLIQCPQFTKMVQIQWENCTNKCH